MFFLLPFSGAFKCFYNEQVLALKFKNILALKTTQLRVSALSDLLITSVFFPFLLFVKSLSCLLWIFVAAGSSWTCWEWPVSWNDLRTINKAGVAYVSPLELTVVLQGQWGNKILLASSGNKAQLCKKQGFLNDGNPLPERHERSWAHLRTWTTPLALSPSVPTTKLSHLRVTVLGAPSPGGAGTLAVHTGLHWGAPSLPLACFLPVLPPPLRMTF